MEQVQSLKFYWNGLKINDGKLMNVIYNMPGTFLDVGTLPVLPITMHKYDYGVDYPAELFDSFGDTAYVADQVQIDTDNPLYPFARMSLMKLMIHRFKQYIKHPVADDVDSVKSNIALLEAEIKKLGNKQPTLSILHKTVQYMDGVRAAYKAKKEAMEREEEARARAKNLRVKTYAERLMAKLKSLYPIKKGEPWVEFPWSESSGIGGGEKMSLIAAEKFLPRMDKNFNVVYGKNHGYDKTEFIVHFEDKNGNLIDYEDRYDIGCERRTLLESMMPIMDEYYEHHEEEEGRTMYKLFMDFVTKYEEAGLEEY